MGGKRIAVTINPDGTIKAETLGIKGKTCLDYVPVLEELLDAETLQSAFTSDYQAADEDVTTATAETISEQSTS